MPTREQSGPVSPFAYRVDRDSDRKLKKMAVLREAAAQFCEHGYAATQMSEVARRLGVTKPTIYYYFKNKEDVLVACFETGFELFQDALTAEPLGTRNGADQLASALCRYGELVTQDFGRCTVRIHAADLGADGRARIAASRRRFDVQVRRLIEIAVADGSLPACEPKLAAFTVLGSLNWLGHWYKEGLALSREEAARQVVEQLFRGLGAQVAAPAKRPPSGAQAEK